MPGQVNDDGRRVEVFNEEVNQRGLAPGSNKMGSPGVNKLAQPNLNNSLMGKVEAVHRLLSTAAVKLTDNEIELLRLWFEYGQFDAAVHDEVLQAMQKVAKQLPRARKVPGDLMYRGFTFKQAEFDAAMRRGSLKLKPRTLSAWTLSQKIAGDYAKMALQEPGHIGVIVSRSVKSADVLMYADASVLKALGLDKAEDQKEVIVKGNGLPATLMPDFIDFVFIPKVKKFVSMDQYLTMRGIE